MICYDDATPLFGQVLSAAELPGDTKDFSYMFEEARRVPETGQVALVTRCLRVCPWFVGVNGVFLFLLRR